jgi:hypothetical protein
VTHGYGRGDGINRRKQDLDASKLATRSPLHRSEVGV